MLYERYVRRRPSSLAPRTVETWWWAVYILSAPLLFDNVRLAASVPPLIGLFFTRFVVETLDDAAAHWTVAVSAGPADLSDAAAVAGLQTVLPD